MKTIKPVGKMVLVKIVEADKTVGGLSLPNGTNMNKQYVVKGIGEEVTKVKVDDEIISGGQIILLDNFDVEKGLGLVHQDQILGVLNK